VTDPSHATIEEFAADGYTHVQCYCPAMPMNDASPNGEEAPMVTGGHQIDEGPGPLGGPTMGEGLPITVNSSIAL
jgi:hypothetical protein